MKPKVYVWGPADTDSPALDKYTVQIGRDVFTMSANPLSPQGVNLYAFSVKNEIARVIDERDPMTWDAIPADVKTAICNILDTQEATND